MKKLLLIAACALPLLWTACSGDTPAEKEDIVPQGMRAVDLKPMGFTVKINVPDSSIGVLDTMNTPTGIQIRVGNKYDVLVNTAGAEEQDLKKQQEIIKASVDVGETNFLVSDSTTLVWETKFGDLAQYHFFHLLKRGTDAYYVRDNNSNPENQFKKEEIDKMVESAKSLRLVATPKAE